MEQILNINDHAYWVEHKDKKELLEAKINEYLAAGHIYQDGDRLELDLAGTQVALLVHVQTAESRVSGDVYNILDFELIHHG